MFCIFLSQVNHWSFSDFFLKDLWYTQSLGAISGLYGKRLRIFFRNVFSKSMVFLAARGLVLSWCSTIPLESFPLACFWWPVLETCWSSREKMDNSYFCWSRRIHHAPIRTKQHFTIQKTDSEAIHYYFKLGKLPRHLSSDMLIRFHSMQHHHKSLLFNLSTNTFELVKIIRKSFRSIEGEAD